MLYEIAEDNISQTLASNQPMFTLDIDYDAICISHKAGIQRWVNFTESERIKYKDQRAFLSSIDAIDPKDSNLIPAKNFAILNREIKEQIDSVNSLQLLSVDILDVDASLLELAETLENIPDIRELYKLRKRTTGKTKNAGISADEAQRIKNCFIQGRELYIAGRQGSLMVKPLNFFYALTAYAYGIIVLNNPLRFGKGNIPGSHGMSYLPDTIQAQFGGDSARGTFSDLVTAFPTQLVKTPSIEFKIDCSQSITSYYETKFSVSLGTLLSMVPEMAEYYKLTTGKNSRCHPVEISIGNDPRSLTWGFHIGDGEFRPSIDAIEAAFKNFSRTERSGKVIVTVPASTAPTMKATIYTDVRGKLWFIENPFFPIILPEPALHFLITSMFSNIMRYRPDEWGSVLTNEISSNISLMTRHYFSSFQRKFFIVILRSLSRYIPYAS